MYFTTCETAYQTFTIILPPNPSPSYHRRINGTLVTRYNRREFIYTGFKKFGHNSDISKVITENDFAYRGTRQRNFHSNNCYRISLPLFLSIPCPFQSRLIDSPHVARLFAHASAPIHTVHRLRRISNAKVTISWRCRRNTETMSLRWKSNDVHDAHPFQPFLYRARACQTRDSLNSQDLCITFLLPGARHKEPFRDRSNTYSITLYFRMPETIRGTQREQIAFQNLRKCV